MEKYLIVWSRHISNGWINKKVNKNEMNEKEQEKKGKKNRKLFF